MNNNLFKWLDGMHNTGYKVLTLAWVTKKWSPIPFDCYILKYPTNSYIPPHRDKVRNGKHYRINVVLTHPPGGEFECKNCIFRSKWLNFFRPDLETHSVSKVESGTRYVLSIGWTRKI